MSGEIDMKMEGTMIHFKADDVLVQRGTIHNWINTGSAPCVNAFALIDAKPVTAGARCSTRRDETSSPIKKSPAVARGFALT